MMATCRGIDVSAYQSPQNWGALAAGGVVFAMAKASEGQHSRDDRFAAHITGIKAAGLVPGAYHFGWPNQDVAAEAGNYIGAVRPYAGTGFTHWLDLERYSDGRNYAGRSAAQIRAWAQAWITAVRAAFPGQRVGVYTSAADLSSGHYPAGSDALWYPAYPGGVTTWADAEARPRPAAAGMAPLIWQFTSTPTDRDLCYLSEADLRAWAGQEMTDMTPEQAQQLADLHSMLTSIGSLTEKDAKGQPVAHGQGWYSAHTHYDTALANQKLDALTKAVAAVQAQSASNGAQLTKALTALNAISAAVASGGSADGIVAAVKAALAAWHPTVTISG